MNVTITDIAKKAGVSVATVSRVLNHKPDVKAETAESVNHAIELLNYSPNAGARGLAKKKSMVIHCLKTLAVSLVTREGT